MIEIQILQTCNVLKINIYIKCCEREDQLKIVRNSVLRDVSDLSMSFLRRYLLT